MISLTFAAALVSCKRDVPQQAQPKASASPPNPNAYPPERLRHALASLPDHWRSLGKLPDCKARLEKAEQRALCDEAARALDKRLEALDEATPDAARLTLSANAALTSQRAVEALRQRGVARLVEARPNPSARPPQPPPSIAKPRAAPSASVDPHHVHAREQSDPDLDAVMAYSRVVSVALAELRAYLEFAEATRRGLALGEVERIAREQPHWAALRALIDEAYLVESDRALKPRLAALRGQLGAP